MSEQRTIFCDACAKHLTTDLVHGSYVKRAEARIAALTAQRDRLLRFARAEQRMGLTPLDMPDKDYWPELEREYRAARRDLLDYGDIDLEALR